MVIDFLVRVLACFGRIFRGCIGLGKLMTFLELQSHGALVYNF